MAVEIDTATDHVDLWDRLIAFLQLGTTSSGPDWDLIRYEHSEMNAVFRAPGLSGLEDIYVGTGLRVHPDIDTFSIGFWMNRAWNDALDTFSQPGYSGTVWMPVFDNVMPYWFIANGQRLMVAAKVSTVYTSGYVGKFLPYGLPSEYPQPYYLGATAAASTQRWSDTSESVRNFFDPGPHCLLGGPSAVWRSIGNFQQISGENAIDNYNYIHPFSGNISGNSVMSRYRELRDNLDGTYPLLPLILHGENPELNVYGELDGAFAIPAFSAATEDVIQIDGADYLVLQNVFRTARYYYGALKLE